MHLIKLTFHSFFLLFLSSSIPLTSDSIDVRRFPRTRVCCSTTTPPEPNRTSSHSPPSQHELALISCTKIRLHDARVSREQRVPLAQNYETPNERTTRIYFERAQKWPHHRHPLVKAIAPKGCVCITSQIVTFPAASTLTDEGEATRSINCSNRRSKKHDIVHIKASKIVINSERFHKHKSHPQIKPSGHGPCPMTVLIFH